MNRSKFYPYRLSKTKCQETTISQTSVDTRKFKPQPHQRKTLPTRMVCLQKKMDLVKTQEPTLLASPSPDIRERELTPRADQETFTTHQAKSLDTLPSSPTTTTSTATKVSSILWSKSSRLKCANISLTLENAHLCNSASSLTDQQSLDNQMT